MERCVVKSRLSYCGVSLRRSGSKVSHAHTFVAQAGLTSTLFPRSRWVWAGSLLFDLFLYQWCLAYHLLVAAERVELILHVAKLVLRQVFRDGHAWMRLVDHVLKVVCDTLCTIFGLGWYTVLLRGQIALWYAFLRPAVLEGRVLVRYASLETVALILWQITHSAGGLGAGAHPVGYHFLRKFAHDHFIQLNILFSAIVALAWFTTENDVRLLRCTAINLLIVASIVVMSNQAWLLRLRSTMCVILVAFNYFGWVTILRRLLNAFCLFLQDYTLRCDWPLRATLAKLGRKWLLLVAFLRVFKFDKVTGGSTALLLIRVVWCFSYLALGYLVRAEGARVASARNVNHARHWLLSLVLSCCLSCVWWLEVGLHGGLLLRLTLLVPQVAIRVLPLNSSWWGACLPDLVVLLDYRSLCGSLLSILRLLVRSWIDCRLPLLDTSLFFFHGCIGLRLILILSIETLQVFSTVRKTDRMALIEQIMVDQICCVLRLE